MPLREESHFQPGGTQGRSQCMSVNLSWNCFFWSFLLLSRHDYFSDFRVLRVLFLMFPGPSRSFSMLLNMFFAFCTSRKGKLKELEGHCRKLEVGRSALENATWALWFHFTSHLMPELSSQADLKNRPAWGSVFSSARKTGIISRCFLMTSQDARDESGMSKTTTGILIWGFQRILSQNPSMFAVLSPDRHLSKWPSHTICSPHCGHLNFCIIENWNCETVSRQSLHPAVAQFPNSRKWGWTHSWTQGFWRAFRQLAGRRTCHSLASCASLPFDPWLCLPGSSSPWCCYCRSKFNGRHQSGLPQERETKTHDKDGDCLI